MNNLFYAPGDDTFTFIKTLEARTTELTNSNVIIEIGCGNGLITKFLTDTFPTSLILSTDINIEALNETSKYNKNLIHSSLLQNINQDYIDVVIFNPPYVETSDDELCFDDIRASYSGGLNGRRIIERFIDEIVNIKVIFLLVIRKNDPEYILEKIRMKGYRAEIIKVRRIMAETINIIRGEYKPDQ